MTRYAGVESLDAEIILDLIKGEVTMDYTLNRFGRPLDSNHSVTVNSQWRTFPWRTRLKYAFLDVVVLSFGAISLILIIPLASTLFNLKIITSEKMHYDYQNFLNWYFSHKYGVFEISQEGPLNSNKLVFLIPTNIGWEYELSGEYKEKIKTISFLRNFIKHKRYGISPELKQDGWQVLFEFIEPPQSGSCLVKYTG